MVFEEPHSKEARRKMSESHKGLKHSEETKRKISEKMEGGNNPAKRPEVRKKISDSLKGKNHPNYGKELSKATREKISESKMGKKNPNWKGGKVSKICPVCGEIFYVKPYVEEKRITCSRECWAEWFSGENHPSFKNWASLETYPKSWYSDLRKEVLDRDNYKCVFCGLSDLESRLLFGRSLTIHHMDGNKDNGSINNLITLCMHCHQRWHGWLERG